MKNTGFGYLHFTLSAWETEEDMKKFYREGPHLNAMKKTSVIAAETRTYSYKTETFPKWNEAKELLLKNGKALRWS
jgi:hypothetical protein